MRRIAGNPACGTKSLSFGPILAQVGSCPDSGHRTEGLRHRRDTKEAEAAPLGAAFGHATLRSAADQGGHAPFSSFELPLVAAQLVPKLSPSTTGSRSSLFVGSLPRKTSLRAPTWTQSPFGRITKPRLWAVATPGRANVAISAAAATSSEMRRFMMG